MMNGKRQEDAGRLMAPRKGHIMLDETHCDALVLFGAAGDLAFKKIFPALYAMSKRLLLDSFKERQIFRMLKSIDAVSPKNVLRGQFRGYREEAGVATSSEVETFVALRLNLDSPRWGGVPFYIRAGKALPVTCTEVVVRLRRPITILPNTMAEPNYFRFRISPDTTMAMGITVMDGEERGVGETRELLASRHAGTPEMDAYERVLTDALTGDQTLFARQDHVEEAWRIVDPLLGAYSSTLNYEPGTWGPVVADDHVLPAGGWQNPVVTA